MGVQTERPDREEIEAAVKDWGDMLFRLCFTMLGNQADAEDAVSETIISYMEKAPAFADKEHRKAWLIKVASNKCRDMLRAYRRRRWVSLEDVKELCREERDRDVLYELLNLPPKYRLAVYLHYVAGYKTAEMAAMLGISPAAARKRLEYGRKMLKLSIGKE